jgi:glutathione S-transferase
VSEALTLVSHALCPYVQRAAIVLAEKGVAFERRWVDLADKPGWFTAVSPLGKTPVLLVGTQAVFESAVICEYLDETHAPRLHPGDALERARHRAWVEFGSAMLDAVGAYYAAPDAQSLQARREVLQKRIAQLESALHPRGPWFAGESFSIVDAAFAPLFRYFDAFEAAGEHGWFDEAPTVRRWRLNLAARPSVRDAVLPDFAARLRDFLLARGSELSRRMRA